MWISTVGGQPAPSLEEPPAARRAVQGDVVQLAPVGERKVEPGDRIAELRVAGQAAGFDADHDCLIKRAASGLDGVPSRFGAIGDMRTNAQPASRNERITGSHRPHAAPPWEG